MTFRLVSALIFLFCGTMTFLFVRSVLHPEASNLAAVAPNVPFDLFAPRTDGSSLDVWDGNRIVGVCDITPHPAGTGRRVRRENVLVKVEIRIALPQEFMGSGRLDVTGDFLLHSNGNVDIVTADFLLDGSLPQLRLSLRQSDDKRWPALKLTKGGEILFESAGGLRPDGVNGLIVSAMLRNAGISEDALSAKAAQDTGPATVRAGHIEAGGETFDGYLLTSGASPETQFRLYMSNTGQILRITTPLSGDNDLGLRLLAKSLAPADARRPAILDSYRLPRRRP